MAPLEQIEAWYATACDQANKAAARHGKESFACYRGQIEAYRNVYELLTGHGFED